MGTKINSKNILIAFTSSIFLLYTLNILDFLSIGTKLYRKESHGENLETFNMIVFTTSCIASQCVFGGMSKFKAGICGGPIFESVKLINDIHDICENNTETAVDSVTNAYFAVMVSTLLFAILSFVLGMYNLGMFFDYIPKMALYGVMASIGIGLCEAGFSEIYISGYSPDIYIHVSCVCTAFLVLFAYYLERNFPGYIFFIPLYSMMVVILFYVTFFTFGCNMEWLRSHKLIPEYVPIVLSLNGFTKYLSPSKVRLGLFLKCLPRILDLAFTNMIHITVNVPGFSAIMNLPVNINDEFKTQGYANLISAILGFPTYFINCTSVYFNKSGGTSKFHSLLGGVLLTGLIYIGPKARAVLPRILLAFIPVYIGGAFIISNIIDNIGCVSTMDMSIIIISCIIGYIISPVMGLILGSSLNALIILYSYNNWLGTCNEEGSVYYNEVQKAYKVVKIDFIAFFMNLNMLRKRLDVKGEKILIDMRQCPYIDAESNNILSEYIDKCEGDVFIIGRPVNLYTKRVSKYMI
ncbi:hypothetical protein P3W45_001820 [Vairimorpha bombi]|jgi:sulfate permease, SulP family